ncbi:LuxR family two component transcriptional regulator [Georgenia soli]|uniref:LuxR family two component transcriptional regulator n=1 Tax=Georgenia soli TaxID=638953 RepID=A0A2A9EHD2_9MICO|nr:response regulator transcription factor [Georgenia soli]PFG38467.1 LuxR family two component transcriptional regulator [Georgenia soli]
MSGPVRVVIVDDHPVVRAGLRAVLEAREDIAVVADHARGEDLLAALGEGAGCDVVLMDLQLGRDALGGVEVTRRVRAAGGPPVVVLTTYDSDADIVAALDAGASGYLLKDAPTGDLVDAVRAAAAGRTALGPAVQERLVDRLRSPATTLTAREVEVLERLAHGDSNEAIAAALFLSRATVKTHLVHIYDKLGVSSRTAAVAQARARGILRT